MQALLNTHSRSLQATASSVDLEQFARIAHRIATCEHLDIYGIGGSAGMATEMAMRLYRIGINVHAWPEVHVGLTSAAIQDGRSVAIGISNTGRTLETVQMLSQARSSGAFTVALTNRNDSPLAQLADEHLLTATPDEYLQPDELSAKHAQLFVLDLLYVLVAQQNFPRTTTKLAASAMAVLPHRRAVRKQPAPARSQRRGGRAEGRPQAEQSQHPAQPPHPRQPPQPPPPLRTRRAARSGRTSRMADLITSMAEQTTSRIERIAEHARSGGLDDAIALIVDSVANGGVLQAFGTGHSQAFAMEIAGRAGGLIPTARVALGDLVAVLGQDRSVLANGSSLEREPTVVDDLWQVADPAPADVFLIASNSGVNGSIVGFALKAKENGHAVIAVTSLEHTARVTPKHPSGKRLSEIADVVIDNLAPYGDATLTLDRRRPGRRGVVHDRRLHRAAAHHRGRRATGGGRQRSAHLPVRQHPRRRRAQPPPRGPVRRPAPPARLTTTPPLKGTNTK